MRSFSLCFVILHAKSSLLFALTRQECEAFVLDVYVRAELTITVVCGISSVSIVTLTHVLVPIVRRVVAGAVGVASTIL